MPGLAAACGAKGVPKGAIYLYSLSWVVATLISGSVYWALSKLFPFEVSPSQEMYMDGIDGIDGKESSLEEVTQVSGKAEKKEFDFEL